MIAININDINEIVTHDGKFHCDEVVGVAILYHMTMADIHRSRNRKDISPAEGRVVLDVGGVYDPTNGMFDHHQRDFTMTRQPREDGVVIGYATAGLIWLHYGRELIKRLIGKVSDEMLENIWKDIDEKLMVPIDANDIGAERQGGVYGAALPITISGLNTAWYEDEKEQEFAFNHAIKVAYLAIVSAIKNSYGMLKASSIVHEAAAKTENGIMVLDIGLPWKPFIAAYSNVQFVVIPDNRGWNVQAVDDEVGFYRVNRKLLPEAWAGLNGDELSQMTGVKDCVFCHKARFICKALSKEGALQLAKMAVEN